MKAIAAVRAACCALEIRFRSQARVTYACQRTGGPGSHGPGRGAIRRQATQPGARMQTISRRSREFVRDRITTAGTAPIRA